jgi:hypothetical protein
MPVCSHAEQTRLRWILDNTPVFQNIQSSEMAAVLRRHCDEAVQSSRYEVCRLGIVIASGSKQQTRQMTPVTRRFDRPLSTASICLGVDCFVEEEQVLIDDDWSARIFSARCLRSPSRCDPKWWAGVSL